MLKKGIFTISIDTELAWGTFDHGGHIRYKEAYSKYRVIVRRLLDLFNAYAISATWAVVGHLFLENCSREKGVSHARIIRPAYSWFRNDWFAYDPVSDISADNFWYGKDIVEMIKESSVPQEIACHSFSHIIFSDPECTIEAAESDISECVRLAREAGIDMDSFVFPRNGIGFVDILEKYGFKAYRSASDAYKKKFLARARGLLEDILAITPALEDTRKDRNLTVIPASMLFRYSYGLSRLIPRGARAARARKGLNKAAKSNKLFHLWLHPMNFGWNTRKMFNEFEKILEYAARLRDTGRIAIMPLREIALNSTQ